MMAMHSRTPVAGSCVILVGEQGIPALAGMSGTITEVKGKRYAFKPHARQATPATEQWLENAIETGITRHQFAIVDQPIANLVLNHKSPNKERHAYSLNIVFDTGSNISVTFSRELLDPSTITKYNKPSGTEVHGGGVAYATHWGYATMRLGNGTHRLRMDLMPTCRTTIIAGGDFDNGHLAFSSVNRTLSIYLVSDMQQPLAQFPRTMDKQQWKGANPDFLSSLTLEGGVAICSLFPVPDNTFDLHGPGKHHGAYSKITSATLKAKAVSFQPAEPTTAKSPSVVDKTQPALPMLETSHSQQLTKSIINLEEYHALRGHRSYATDVLMYGWEHNYQLHRDILQHIAKCAACEQAKITNDTMIRKRLLPPDHPGQQASADLLVDMPRSISGYKHYLNVHDICSGYGDVFLLRTRACADKLLYWLKWLYNTTGRHVLLLSIDGGELNTTEVTAYVTQNGGKTVINLPHVHQNTTIERRHRTVNEIAMSAMKFSGAPPELWEFAVPWANEAMVLYPSPTALQRVGKRRGTDRLRPLSPYELLLGGKELDMAPLWANHHPIFTACAGYLEQDARQGHEARGFPGVYFGPIASQALGVEQRGHYVLRTSDQRVVRCRTVSCDSKVYPFRLTMTKTPSTKTEQAATPALPSGGEGTTEHDSDSAKSEGTPDAAANTIKPENNHDDDDHEEKKEERKDENVSTTTRIIGPDKFEPGTHVMTTAGTCVVVRRYADGDYCVRYPETSEPQEHYCVKPHQMWLTRDHADWDYNADGQRADPIAKQAATSDKRNLSQQLTLDALAARTGTTAATSAADIEPEGGKPRHRFSLRPRHATTLSKTFAARGISWIRRPWDPSGPLLSPLYPSATSLLDLEHQDKEPSEATKQTNKAQKPRIPAPKAITKEEIAGMAASDVERMLPQHYHQTLSSPLRKFIAKGEENELQDCINREVWGKPIRDTELPEGVKVIPLMWAYAVKKHDENGLFRKFRSRITLMGNHERNVLTKLEAYAPVHMAITARLLVALHLGDPDVVFRKLDVQNAYINEFMKRKVWCRCPPGYKLYVREDGIVDYEELEPGETTAGTCVPLIKALYGGMECGRIFWEAFVQWHLADGFQLIHEDRCYLEKRDSLSGSWIKLCFHVDDNMIATKGKQFYADYLKRLTSKFDVAEAALTSHLGTNYHFSEDNTKVLIEQTCQVEKMLKEFGFENCSTANAETAVAAGAIQPNAADCEDTDVEPFDMESFVGHGTYLCMCTRPDISLPLKILSRHTKKFGKRHVAWAKHLLRFLRGTKSQGLTYRSGFPLYIQIFTDASHASDIDTRRSITSVVIKVGGNTVYWKSSFTKIVSHSSTESELMALDIGATLSEMVRWLIQAMGGPVQGTTEIFVDNTSTISISSNPVQSGRNLHVHARFYYVRDLVYDQLVRVEHLETSRQVADIGCSNKGNLNFLTLRNYLINCARVVLDKHQVYVWEVYE